MGVGEVDGEGEWVEEEKKEVGVRRGEKESREKKEGRKRRKKKKE